MMFRLQKKNVFFPLRKKTSIFFIQGLYRAGYLTGTQATGAGVNPTRGAVHNRLDALNIGLPSTVRTPVRVGNLDTEGNTLAADVTFCHNLHLLNTPKSQPIS